jgi:hypothetical protein
MTSSIMNRYYKGSAIEYDEQNAVKNGKTKIRNLFYCQNNSHYKQTVLYYILLIDGFPYEVLPIMHCDCRHLVGQVERIEVIKYL